jgi:DHA1 family tetracycline resistance protein-like MFS transporter
MQFFSSAIWGTISDNLGRKKPLLFSLIITLLGSVCAFFGIYFYSLSLILFSRIVLGCASGNMAIVQATIADISTPEEKTKNFGLFGMMIGLGFTVGPLMGGLLSYFSYSTPFLVASLFAALNWVAALLYFRETLLSPLQTKINWKAGFINLKKAFYLKGLRTIFLAAFLANFAWVFFVEFISVYLIGTFHFSSTDLGIFFAVGSGAYALNSGLLIRPVAKWLRAETLFFGGIFLSGISILAMLLYASQIWIWSLLVIMFYFSAFIQPSCSTLVSNRASPEIQGEALGVLGSVFAIATVLSSLFSGSLVGKHPTLPIWGGGVIMLATGLMLLAVFRKDLFGRYR